LLAALMTTLTRLLARLLLSAALLLLAGLLPATTLLLARAWVALLRLVRLRLIRVVHYFLLGLSPSRQRKEPEKVAAQNDRFASIADEFPPISARILPKLVAD
jgi:hypothetical protein